MDTHFSDRDYLDRLVARLSEACARNGWIPEMMPASSDIDGKWNSLLEGFIGDAVHEFNSYPEVTLAWAGYIGCAAAELWDDDFEAFKALAYDDLKGKRGFDDLDEHVLADVLGMPVGSPQAKELERKLAYCAAEALGALRHEPVEDLTAEAYKVFLRSIEAMYRLGAALHLAALGYKFVKEG
ncbi:MAG: hypothetical protein ACI4AE_05095 [Candidatus Cryptobacteroides sp.]